MKSFQVKYMDWFLCFYVAKDVLSSPTYTNTLPISMKYKRQYSSQFSFLSAKLMKKLIKTTTNSKYHDESSYKNHLRNYFLKNFVAPRQEY